MRPAPRLRTAVLIGATVLGGLAPFLAGWFNPLVLFNLGPSDHTYIDGFEPEWEIDPEGLATHWASHRAQVRLPLAVARGPATIAVRATRVYPQTGTTVVRLNGRATDTFESRGGRFFERTIEIPPSVVGSGPLIVTIDTEGDDKRDRGLLIDWMRIDAGRLSPAPRVAWIAASVGVVLAALAFVLIGSRPATVLAALAAPVGMVIYGVWAGPFPLAHLLLRTGWLMLLAPLAALWPARRLVGSEARLAVWMAVVALFLRLAGLFHPLYYYPDLRAHAVLARIVGDVGLDFWRRPSFYIIQQGVWAEEALGKTYAFPFSPVFHALFAPWSKDLLATMDAMKLAACVISSVEVLIVFAIGRRLGGNHLAAWAAALAVVAPPSLSRLGWAFMAAIFAHLFESLALKTLFEGRLEARRIAVFAAFLVIGLGSYAGSLINFGIFVPVAGVALLLSSNRLDRREGMILMATAAGAAVVTMAVVYREFFRTFVSDMLPRFASGESRRGTLGFGATLSMIWRRLYAFFGWWYVPAFLAAPVLWWQRRPSARHARLLIAWTLTFLALVFLRTVAPDLFSRVKEMLWVSPLVALAGGLCLSRLKEQGTRGSVAAWVAFASLAVYGIAFYAWNVTEKFVLAR